MIYELIATIAAGFVGAGVALATRAVIRTLPRFVVPVCAGAAMLMVAIALEYSWFDRTKDNLPEGVEVALTRENRAPWRPWTYIYAYVDGFVAVDQASARTHGGAPDNRMVDLLVYGRWAAPSRVRAVFDCEVGRRADLVEGVSLADDGSLEGARWIDTGTDHPVTRLACGAVS